MTKPLARRTLRPVLTQSVGTALLKNGWCQGRLMQLVAKTPTLMCMNNSLLTINSERACFLGTVAFGVVLIAL